MSVVPSGEQFEIVAGDHRATLVEVGGGIRAYTFAGTDYQVALTEPESHNAIHGFLRWRNWTLRERAIDRVVLGTVLHPLPGYPFTLDIAIDYALHDTDTDTDTDTDAGAGADRPGLTVSTTATNLGGTPCPYAAGQHPYLSAGTEFIDEATLTLDAASWLPTDDRGLPTGTEPVAGSPYDFRTPRLIGDTHIDNAFTGLTRDGDGLAWVQLTAPDGRRVRLWTDEHYRFIELYTGDTLPPDQRRRGLGVEPMTCAPNGFHSGDGLLELDPGQTITTRWGIHPD